MNDIRPILGHPGYYVSIDGRIFSEVMGGFKEIVQAYGGSGGGYRYVALGRRFSTGVHQLVAQMFVSVPMELVGQRLVVRHRDNNPSNNHADNLEWGTQAQNLADRIAAGTMTWGERNGGSKLTVEQVIEIRRRRAAKERCRDIARDFNIGYQQVHRIGAGHRWSHVDSPIALRQRASRKESKCSA